MAEQVLTVPSRIFSANATLEPGAKLYFYETGTTTRLPVYTSPSPMIIEHPVPLVADAQGVIPQVFHDASVPVKIVATDASDVVLDGYPIDPAITTSTGSNASQIAFAPVTGNPETDAQAAIENNTTLAVGSKNAFENATGIPKTSGSGNAYTISPAATISAYAERQMFRFIVDRDASGSITLNVDSVGAVNVKRYNTSLNKTDVDDWRTGEIKTVTHDGTHLVEVSPPRARHAVKGIILKATTSEAKAGTATDKYADVVEMKAAIAEQSPIKARCSVDGTAGTPVASDALNIGSITDNGLGDYTIIFAAAMADVNYQASVSVEGVGGVGGRTFVNITKTTGNIRIYITDVNGTAIDRDITLVVFGG